MPLPNYLTSDGRVNIFSAFRSLAGYCNRGDSDAMALLEWVVAHKVFSNNRLIPFTEFRARMRALVNYRQFVLDAGVNWLTGNAVVALLNHADRAISEHSDHLSRTEALRNASRAVTAAAAAAAAPAPSPAAVRRKKELASARRVLPPRKRRPPPKYDPATGGTESSAPKRRRVRVLSAEEKQAADILVSMRHSRSILERTNGRMKALEEAMRQRLRDEVFARAMAALGRRFMREARDAIGDSTAPSNK